ncbi:DUF2799 domain-containing protein [Enterobacter sp.]|uniref:DUF2799 domain-containing protein n=1 Tax=Enterobacter sp. TaxID=42895 RepID=UPI00296F1950|nr:DUF2799 domain-containing protein [Enterobacter sp.]
MRTGYFALLAIFLTGCSVDPYTHAPDWSGTDWYSAGKEDAMSGAIVKANETLALDFSDTDVDRPLYLEGYNDGLKKICKDDLLYAWGRAGKIYPAGCDTQQNASQLRQSWQKGMDEGTRESLLN